MKALSRFLFGTLRGRLIISVALVHAVMMSLFMIDLTTRQRDMLLDRQIEEATALSQALATSSAGWIAANDVAGLQELVDAQLRYPEIVFVFLTDKDGRVLAGTDKSRQGQFMLDLPLEANLTVLSSTPSLVDVVVPAMIAERHVGWARVGIGQKAASEKLAQIVRSGVIYTLIAILTGSIIAWFMGSQITRRLYAIQKTMDVVRSGNRLARSTLTGDDESAIMAREFNSMLDDLSERGAELRESETKLQTIFARSRDAIGVSKNGIHVFVNPAYVFMFGYDSADELIDTPIINLIAPESREMVRKYVQSRAQGLPTPSDYEVNGLRKNGCTFIMDVRTSTYVLQDEQYTLVILRDITERKQAEEKIRRQINYLTALQDIDRTIAADFNMYTSLNALIAKTISLLKVDAAAILLINFNTDTLEFFAGKGFHTEAIKTAHMKVGESYAGRAAIEKRIVKFPNPKDESDDLFFTNFLYKEKFSSYYGVPLIIKGQAIGVLEAYQRSLIKRDQEWLDFLNSLAGQAAVAISNAKLFDNLQNSNKELIQAYDATIEGWSRAMDLRDRETEGHTQRVATLTVQLAQKMGISETDILHIRRGALLHDIGKIGVSDSILRKPDRLTPEEWKEMRLHPVYAYEMLALIPYLKPALDIPYCHHEKWDGSGYPRGLKKEEIPLVARLFAVADVYDAITSDRPYRKSWTKEHALQYIREQSGAHFDPQIVEKFLELIKE
ncbi:MAG: PAS domain S-box protein [Anaerolineales bacterium]|nr:PAS domain S-box protein [Anaerolineales bacterium]